MGAISLRHFDRRRSAGFLAGLLTVLVLLALGGCGFKPLYGEKGASGKPVVQSALGQVAINPIRSRTGQVLRNELIDRMNPRGQPGVGAAYRLVVRLSVRKQELGIRRDETATRANLILTAAYVMTEASSGKAVLSGISRTITSFNILDNEFATLMGEKDARERGAGQLAEDITTRVALYFNRTKRPVAGK